MKRKCAKVTEWGRCQQPPKRDVLCSFHAAWDDRNNVPPDEPDRAYHRKIVLGLLQPTFDYLTETEANAMLYGRQRQDGRRLDAYVVPDDPVNWEAA